MSRNTLPLDMTKYITGRSGLSGAVVDINGGVSVLSAAAIAAQQGAVRRRRRATAPQPLVPGQ